MVRETEGHESKDVVEKASAINLLLAFAYATKNYLREEYSYDKDVTKYTNFWGYSHKFVALQKAYQKLCYKIYIN